jgi:hypothetical protein
MVGRCFTTCSKRSTRCSAHGASPQKPRAAGGHRSARLLLPIARRIAHPTDLFLRVTQRYEKPARRSTTIDGKPKRRAVTESTSLSQLVHFRRAVGPARTRGTLVAPLVTTTLLRDTVRAPPERVWSPTG